MYFVPTGLWVPAHATFPLDYPKNPKPYSFSLDCQDCMSSEINPKATMVAWRSARQRSQGIARFSLVLCTLVMRRVLSAQ